MGGESDRCANVPGNRARRVDVDYEKRVFQCSAFIGLSFSGLERFALRIHERRTSITGPLDAAENKSHREAAHDRHEDLGSNCRHAYGVHPANEEVQPWQNRKKCSAHAATYDYTPEWDAIAM